MLARKQLLLVAVLAIVAVPAFAETYKDPSGFSFEYPAGWEAISGRGARPDMSKLPKETRDWMNRTKIDLSGVNAILIRNSDDEFLENLNVVAQDGEIPATDKSAKELNDLLPKQFRSMGAQVTGFEAKVGELNGKKLIYASFQNKMPGINIPLRVRQYYIPGGGKTYIVTITMPEATNKQYAPVFAKIMNSFKVPAAKSGGFQLNRALAMGLVGGVVGGVIGLVLFVTKKFSAKPNPYMMNRRE